MTLNGTLKSQKRLIASRRRANKNFQRDLKAWTEEHDLIVPLFQTMLADVKDILPEYSNTDYQRDLLTFTRRFDHEGVGFVTKVLPSLFDEFMSMMEGRATTYPGFKKAGRRAEPSFLGGIMRIVLAPTTQQKTRVAAFDAFYQITVAFSKLKGPYAPAGLTKQLREFVQTDENLPEKLEDFSAECLSVIDVARDIITEVFSGYQLDKGSPRPGPGATNTPVPKSERYKPRKLYRQIDETLPYMDLFYPHWYYAFINSAELRSLYIDAVWGPTSRFKFVPKKAKKARGICIEENEMQFAQQSIRDYMVRTIESHPMTRGRVNFTDQKINQFLALLASSDKSLATLDAKEASDRVSRILVYLLFSKCVELRDVLMALSTREIVLPPDLSDVTSLRAKKYAPMGSALCFPVMGMVFFALIRALIILKGNSDNDSDRVYVYGDDIIIPVRHAEMVFEWLPRFGFKLNMDKSFFRSRFRESCGVHAFCGQNVTPVYLKKIPNTRLKRKGLVTKKDSVNSLLAIISVERDLYKKGFLRTCELLRQATEDCIGRLPYVGPRSPVVGWKRPVPDASVYNSIKRVKYERALQKWMFKVRVMKPVTTEEHFDTHSAYLKWLTASSRKRPRTLQRFPGWSVLNRHHGRRASQSLDYYLSSDGDGQRIVKGRVVAADSIIGSCEHIKLAYMYVDEPTMLQ